MSMAKVFYHDGTVEEVHFESMTFDPEYPADIDFWTASSSLIVNLREVSIIELDNMVILPRVYESERPA